MHNKRDNIDVDIYQDESDPRRAAFAVKTLPITVTYCVLLLYTSCVWITYFILFSGYIFCLPQWKKLQKTFKIFFQWILKVSTRIWRKRKTLGFLIEIYMFWKKIIHVLLNLFRVYNLTSVTRTSLLWSFQIFWSKVKTSFHAGIWKVILEVFIQFIETQYGNALICTVWQLTQIQINSMQLGPHRRGLGKQGEVFPVSLLLLHSHRE